MSKFNVDFSGVGDGFTLPPEGEYICKVTGVELKDGKAAKYLNWILTIGTGDYKGTKIYHMTSFAPNALFNMRNFLIACGNDVPKKAFQVNTDTCIGKVVGIVAYHDEYEKDGKKKKSLKVDEVYRVVKGSNGWVRIDENKTAAAAVITPPQDEEDEVPFDKPNTAGMVDLDDDEIDI